MLLHSKWAYIWDKPLFAICVRLSRLLYNFDKMIWRQLQKATTILQLYYKIFLLTLHMILPHYNFKIFRSKHSMTRTYLALTLLSSFYAFQYFQNWAWASTEQLRTSYTFHLCNRSWIPSQVFWHLSIQSLWSG